MEYWPFVDGFEFINWVTKLPIGSSQPVTCINKPHWNHWEKKKEKEKIIGNLVCYN